MFSSAEKTVKSAPAIQQKAAGATFFRKAGEESFFGAKESPSFFGKPIQTKLTVSTPDDPHEKEADAVADKVMRMEASPVVATALPVPDKNEQQLQRKEEKEEIQAKEEAPTIARTLQCKQQP